MKTILFVRHGKSSWEDNVSDKDRTLKQRGIDDAHLVSNALKSSNTGIDYVFSSPANRALHTCIIFTRNLNLDLNKLQISEALYDFSGEQVLDFLTRVNDDYNSFFDLPILSYIFWKNDFYCFTFCNTLPTSNLKLNLS